MTDQRLHDRIVALLSDEMEREYQQNAKDYGPPRGFCQQCGQSLSVPGSGWVEVGEYEPDPSVDIQVEQWGGGWFMACYVCNISSKRPDGIA